MSEAIGMLAKAVATIDTQDDARAFLADLCTPSELKSLSERLHVASLLADGDKTYRAIHDETGVSTTTIVRVARFLNEEGNGGYRALLARLAKDEA